MNRSMTLRRSLAALAAPLLLSGLVACGSDEPADQASSSSQNEPTETGAVDKAEFVDDLKAGLEASTTASMSMHMNMGGQEVHADGELDYASDPVEMAMTMESPALGGEPMDLRLVDNVMYMNMGPMSKDKFIMFDFSDPQSLPPAMDQLSSMMDPLEAMEALEQGVKSAVFLGEEEVDGEELGHYKVEVDPTKVEQFNQLPPQVQLPKTVSYDLWLDDENRMRKMDMTTSSGAGEMAVEMELFDWGKPVDITAPPASEVVDPSKMAG